MKFVNLTPHEVSMHLLVLSAFRRNFPDALDHDHPVSMHLLVLSAFRPLRRGLSVPGV